jgi:gelsolin
MLKAKEYNIADSNIANLGTDLEKKVREAAAQNEKAWAGLGKQPGLWIWRIEKFMVVPVPKETYGKFHSGDSYIILHSYKKNAKSAALAHDIHFWLGKYTSQDEAGTAAYKTVELDDYLGGLAVQHREVQGYESTLFSSYFQNQIVILEGGIESGFNHVEPEKYRPRLLHLKGIKKVRVQQVEISYKSLNSGDVFVLDVGKEVFQWNGKESGPMEKLQGAKMTKAIQDQRRGVVKKYILEEGKKSEEMNKFFQLIGGEGPIKSATEGGSDKDVDKLFQASHRLFRLSDSSGSLEFKLEAEADKVTRDKFDTNDVFVFDGGYQIFVWVGNKSSIQEKKCALQYAIDYIRKFNRPPTTPISRIIEGGENEIDDLCMQNCLLLFFSSKEKKIRN